jgi:hypothetical protein
MFLVSNAPLSFNDKGYTYDSEKAKDLVNEYKKATVIKPRNSAKH